MNKNRSSDNPSKSLTTEQKIPFVLKLRLYYGGFSLSFTNMDFLSDQSCYAFYPIPNTGVEQHLSGYSPWDGLEKAYPVPPYLFLQSSKKGPAGSHCPCPPAQNQLELSCLVQGTQGILHQTSASNAGHKISTSGLFLIGPGCWVYHLSTWRRRAGKTKV